MDAWQPCPSSCSGGSAHAGVQRKRRHLATGHLAHALGVLLDVLFAPAARVACAHELGVVFEARRDGLAPVRVALDELDHLGLLLARAPLLESGDIGKDEGVPVVGVARAVGRARCLFRRGRVLLKVWRERLGHRQLPEPEMLETHRFFRQEMAIQKITPKSLSQMSLSRMSLRKSLHRRTHRERGQLAHRAKYGLLEKHKDYVLRARDYHTKQDRLTRLRQKAADRNKDEFYFAMKNERTVEGVHVQDRGNTPMPMDMVKLLKSQDEGYVRTIKTVGLKVRVSPLCSAPR